MSLLSKLLGLLGPRSTSPAGAAGRRAGKAAAPGAPPAPPELISTTAEGSVALRFRVERRELLPMGSLVLHAAALHRGRRAALEVVVGPEWLEVPAGEPAGYRGIVSLRSVGPESDALLRILDEAFGTNLGPKAMARATDFAAVTLGGDPRELGAGAVRARLLFEAAAPEGNAELQADVDLPGGRIELRESAPGQRAAVVRALAGVS